MNNAKEFLFDEEARKKLASGIEKLAKAVRPTLGPKGRNIGMEKSFGAPQMTSDGHTIVQEVELEDQFEEMGAAMGREVAAKLKDVAGDGTTTATILLDSLVQKGVKLVASSASPILIKRGMEKALEQILKKLDEMAIKITTKEETKSIASVAASGEEEIGQMIADAMEKVTSSGVVTIEESKTTESSIEMVEGMQLDRGYLSPYFSTNNEKMICEMNHPYVLVVDKKIASIQELLPILQEVAATAKELLIIAEDIDQDALATLVVNKLRGTLKVAAIKAPGFGENKKAQLEDIAVLCNGQLISEELGLYLKDIKLDSLGSCMNCKITKDKTILVGGMGDKKDIAARVRQLENEKKAASSYDQEKIQERISKLQGGVAVIQVGAGSEVELKQKKQIFEDSLSSTKAALEEGVVIGGGAALIHAAKNIQADLETEEEFGFNIVKQAALEPCRQIIENCGLESSLLLEKIQKSDANIGFNAQTQELQNLNDAKIIDPVKVVKNTIIRAVTTAGIVILSETLIGDAKDLS